MNQTVYVVQELDRVFYEENDEDLLKPHWTTKLIAIVTDKQEAVSLCDSPDRFWFQTELNREITEEEVKAGEFVL